MKAYTRSVMLLSLILLALNSLLSEPAKADSKDKITKIEHYVEEQRQKSNIPGLSLVIVEKGETVYQKGFGYADSKRSQPVTEQTLFEIGSNTKAFTALAILQLEKQGRLRLDDLIQSYIPWMNLTYQGEPQPITLRQLLRHTSGIPSNTITRIPESRADDALAATVKTLIGQPLNRKPGSTFEYATINYDVLGLVIEAVSKQSYESYIHEHILKPIGMDASMVGQQTESDQLANGYKIGLMRAVAYTPPVYRGNTPAGYIISNSNDIAAWMNIQLGVAPSRSFDQQLIIDSHNPDQTVNPFDTNTHYAYGWGIQQNKDKTYILHAGENPAFSSYIIMEPDEDVGIAVLANMRSTVTTAIGQGVMDLWEGRSVTGNHTDSYQNLDQFVTVFLFIVACIGVCFILFIIRILFGLATGQRRLTAITGKRLLLLIVHILIAVSAFIIIVKIPPLLLGGLPWSFILVWAPVSISLTFYTLLTLCTTYLIWGLSMVSTKKVTLKNYF